MRRGRLLSTRGWLLVAAVAGAAALIGAVVLL